MLKTFAKTVCLISFCLTSRLLLAQSGADLYKDIPEAYHIMEQMEKSYPQLVRVVEYGESEGKRGRGHPLWALKFSDNVYLEEIEPNFLFTGATHGDEKITTEALLRHMDRLLSAYQAGEAKAKKLLNENQLLFIPIVNPDGYEEHRRFTINRVDPNRAFPFVNASGVNRNKAQCVDELVDFYHTRNIRGVIDFHAKGELLLIPYADTIRRIPDYSYYQNLANLMNPGQYLVTQTSHHQSIGIKDGASLDYWYSNGSKALSVELARSKTPFSNQTIEQVTDEVQHMIEVFVEELTR